MIRINAYYLLRNQAEIDGKIMYFGPRQYALLLALFFANEKPLNVQALIPYVYPNPETEIEWAEGFIRRTIWCLRKKGVPIKKRYAFGYVLEGQS